MGAHGLTFQPLQVRIQTMRGTLPKKRLELGISLSQLAAAAKVSKATIISRLRGDTEWPINQANSVLMFLLPLDPRLTLESLFGLKPLPPLPNVGQVSEKPVDSGDGEPQLAEVGG